MGKIYKWKDYRMNLNIKTYWKKIVKSDELNRRDGILSLELFCPLRSFLHNKGTDAEEAEGGNIQFEHTHCDTHKHTYTHTKLTMRRACT